MSSYNHIINQKDNVIYVNINNILYSQLDEEKSFQNQTIDTSVVLCDKSFEMALTRRKMSNGDIFLYFDTCISSDIIIKLSKLDVNNVYTFEDKYVKPAFDNRYGEIKTTGPNGYYECNFGSIILTKCYYYNRIIHEYENKGISAVNELIDERNDIKVKEDAISISIFGDYKCNCCFCAIISQEELFKNKDNMNDFFDYYYKGLYNNTPWSSFFIRKDGTYTKLPYSIEPFTRDGYGFSLHHSSHKELIPFLERTKERFFFDMLENGFLQAFLYQPNADGVFITSHTSTWLKKSCGLCAPYIDTRLNETFILTWNDFKKFSPWKNIDPLINYVDFLVTCYKKNNTLYKSEHGILFPDYFNTSPLPLISHTSLNHQIGLALIFSRAYEEYKNDDYLIIFKKIISFIDDTWLSWIDPESGDLIYGLSQDKEGIYRYEGKDYAYVTCIDLLLLQEKHIELFATSNLAVSRLLAAKIEYLKENYGLFSNNPKIAQGERLDSVDQITVLYKRIFEKPECVQSMLDALSLLYRKTRDDVKKMHEIISIEKENVIYEQKRVDYFRDRLNKEASKFLYEQKKCEALKLELAEIKNGISTQKKSGNIIDAFRKVLIKLKIKRQ